DWAAEEGIADEEMTKRLKDVTDNAYSQLTAGIDDSEMQRVEKQVLLQVIDRNWREHLQQLDALKSVIGMRAYGQRDPLNEYKSEAFTLFDKLLISLREDVTAAMFRTLLNVQLQRQQMAMAQAQSQGQQTRSQPASPPQPLSGPRSPMEMMGAAPGLGEAVAPAAKGPSMEDIANLPRNAPCPCGSGRKVKQCHGKPA
ncbi:MAG: SEC-C metal-binding domain-containing protein, partial [Pseudomonadota bacterium]